MADAHRRYTRAVNFRVGWRGHPWQERFYSFVMDEAHLAAAFPCIELNPVRARLCDQPQDWQWSSARTRFEGTPDPLVDREWLERPLPVADGLESVRETVAHEALRQHTRTGRPLGDDGFVERLEVIPERPLKPRRPDPRPKEA